jgi:hypothetical protein
MIEEIRSYISSQIAKVDKDFKFDGYIFENDKTSTNVIDKTYKLVLGPLNPVLLDYIEEAEMNVDVIIFKVSGTKRVEDFDKLYCKAISIASYVTDPIDISQQGFIKSILTRSIAPSAIETDENSVKIKIGFGVRVFYSREK